MPKRKYSREIRQVLGIKKGECAPCPICQRVVELVGDHCHMSQIPRGAVCGNCNSGLGHFRDDIPTMLRAVLYLQRFREEHAVTTPLGFVPLKPADAIEGYECWCAPVRRRLGMFKKVS